MMMRSLTAQTAITIKEILRGGSIIGFMLTWLLLLMTATAFGTVSIGERMYVIKDFGLFLTTLAVLALTISAGASILAKEIRQKHLYTVLSKPVSRLSYLASKLLGIWISGLVLNITLHLVLCCYVYVLEGSWQPTLLINTLFLAMEGLVMAACSLLIASLFVTPMLVGLVSVLIFIAGRNLDSITALLDARDAGFLLHSLLTVVQALMPRLYLLNIVNDLTYAITPSVSATLYATIYGFSYAAACFILSLYVFSRRDFT